MNRKQGLNMIYELNKANYHKANKLFTKLKTNTAIESIFNFKNEARLFVDHPDEPKSIMVLNSWAYYYLAGDANNEDFNKSSNVLTPRANSA